MAIIKLDEGPGLGQLLGTGLGSGVGTGLQRLAQMKINEFAQRQQQQQTTSGLQALGLSPQEASQVSLLPPALQSEVVKNYLSGAESSGVGEALGSLGLGSQGSQQAGVESIPGAQLLSEVVPGETQETQQQQSVQGVAQIAQRPTLRDALTKPRLSTKDRIALAKLEQKEKLQQRQEAAKISAEEKKQSIIDRREAHKDTKSYGDNISKSYKSAVDSAKRLERIAVLNEKGSLGVPLFNNLLKTLKKGIFGFGLDLTAIMSADAQELDKLSTDFIKNVKDIFGARITDNDIKYFLQTIPTLAQSKDGRTKVIRNLQSFDKAARIKKRAYDEIVKKNDGYRPIDIEIQVQEITEPLLKKLAEEFKAAPIGSETKRGTIDRVGKGILWY